jgi:glycosyltransferase involved in cell wall biosynthesis
MKIAYVCADFGIPIRGYKGASVHVREMVAALRARGHEVIVLTPSPGEGNEMAPGVRLRPVAPDWMSESAWRLGERLARSPRSRLPNELRELAYNATLFRVGSSVLREQRPDVVYERYSLLNLSGLLLSRLLRVPHLLEVNAPLRLERARTKGLRIEAAARFAERRLFGGTGAALTVSRALRDYVVARGGRPERTFVQPNGVDSQRFRPGADGPRIRARLGISPDATVVGFSGSLKPWHGTDVLLHAFASLRPRLAVARLLVVGEGPEEASLRRLAARLELGSAVTFTGRMDHDQMPDVVCAMDVAVAPYRQVPDFYFSPLKLYEYMACGRAVVATRTGEVPELVADGQTGLTCPPDDPGALATALERLCGSVELRRQLGAAARNEALRHDWSGHASRLVRLAEDLRAAEAVGVRPTLSLQ